MKMFGKFALLVLMVSEARLVYCDDDKIGAELSRCQSDTLRIFNIDVSAVQMLPNAKTTAKLIQKATCGRCDIFVTNVANSDSTKFSVGVNTITTCITLSHIVLNSKNGINSPIMFNQPFPLQVARPMPAST
jgi:hypothetical protein